MMFMFIYHDFWYSQAVDAFFDVIEVLAIVLLVYAFFKEDSRYMWPYMAIEFTWLIFLLIFYSMAVTTVVWPSGPYSIIVTRSHDDEFKKETGKVRLEALKYALIMMVMALYAIWELRVLLACNRYFDDVKARKQEVQSRPIIISQNDQIASTRINMESDTTMTSQQHKDGAKEPMNQMNGNPSKSFANPNFSLSDSEDEDLWPQRKPTTPKNPALS
uniref:Uncharacterized protein n=1 Tax=Acrobeloides nanus TaxID=290746 RepID=A0A914CXL3_9BILA